VGVVKRWVLRGIWRRLEGVGIIGPGLLGAPAPVLPVGSPETSGYNRFGPPALPSPPGGPLFVLLMYASSGVSGWLT
jgi:hypothetical protein